MATPRPSAKYFLPDYHNQNFLFADCNLNLDTLLVQLLPIRNEYQLFGRVAGISSDKLDNISASTKEPYDALVEVCDLWLQSCKARKIPPTWRLVAEILTVMGQDELSKGILKVYETGNPIHIIFLAFNHK